MAFWAMVHTTAHYINFLNVERTRTFLVSIPLAPLTIFVEVWTQLALQIHYTQPGAITGHFMLFIMKQRVKPGSMLLHKCMLNVWVSLFPLAAAVVVSLEVLPEELSWTAKNSSSSRPSSMDGFAYQQINLYSRYLKRDPHQGEILYDT
jgi:hypothetical protein